MLLRIGSSVAVTAVLGVALIVLSLAIVGIETGQRMWSGLEVAGTVVALPALFCFVKNDSCGAVDNASGVVAVLLAAQSSSAPSNLGILITSGEELGLAGARIWAHAAPPASRILNCDTVDDRGGWRFMQTGAQRQTLAAAAEAVAGRLGVSVKVGRLIPGILADSIAFSDLGIEAATLSRGTLSTLARIHTRRDTSNTLTGKGAAEASALLSALAKELG
jgi:putative aminopeptidase FrvX